MINWDIPKEWGLKKIGEIAPEEAMQVLPKTKPDKVFNYWSLDAISQGQLQEPKPNYVLGSTISSTCISFTPKHVLYAKLRPYLNKVIVPSIEGIGSTEWVVLNPNPNIVFRNYLGYVLRTKNIVEHMTSSSAGARMPRARKDVLFDTEIPIPYPNDPTRSLEIQHHIVNRLDTLLTEVNEARGLLETIKLDLEKLFSSFSRQVFEEIEDKYTKYVLKPLTTKIGSGSTPRGGKSVYVSSGIPFVRSLNVRWNEFSEKDLAYIDEQTHQSMRATEVIAGDIFLNITGASIGRSCCVPEKFCPANVNQHVMIIRPIKSQLRSRYLMYWLTSPNTQNFIMQTQSGATRQALTKEQVENFRIPLPPLDVQNYYVNYLDNIIQEISTMRVTLDEQEGTVSLLEQSFLAQAFCGAL